MNTLISPGAIFLWLYWPSFNSAIATGEEQQVRAIINTYLALASCVLVTFAMSSIFDRHARFNMVRIFSTISFPPHFELKMSLTEKDMTFV